MWKLNCGCGDIPGPIEFKIYDKPIIISKNHFHLPNTTNRNECLKEKIILDYFEIINKLECGIQPGLENILEEISLIEMNSNWNFTVSKRVFSTDNEEEEDYLRRGKYFSEFKTEEEKDRAIKNLGIDNVKHIIVSKMEFDNLDEYVKDAIYFVTQ